MCRMLTAIGNVNLSWLIDDFITIASNKNEKHENNENKDFKHGDGWGLTYFEDNQLKIHKSTKPIYEDDEIYSFKKTNSPFYILHARRGSVGEVKLENVHPFRYSNYIFCHNGTVKEKLTYEKKFIPVGETDSEKLFYYLLSDLENGLNENIIFEKYNRVKDFMGMNSFITDGSDTYIINWYEKKPKYYTFKILKEEDFIIVSSEILPHYKDRNWHKMNNRDILKLNISTQSLSNFSVTI